MELYSPFYRKRGVWRVGDLTSPPTTLAGEFSLPKASVFHFLDWDEVAFGPDLDDLGLRNYDGRMLIEHVGELHKPVGRYRENRIQTLSKIEREYRQRYRKIRPMHDLERSLRDELSLVIVNHAPISHLYIYPRTLYSGYNKTLNTLRATFKQINDRMAKTERQHFISVELPKQLPGPKLLRKASKDIEKLPKPLLERFSDLKSGFILELWKWLGADRDSSVLSEIDADHYTRFNLVWSESGRVTVVNLGSLLAIMSLDETADNEGTTQLQRRTLRMLISLLEYRSGVSSDYLDEEIEDADETSTGGDDAVQPDRKAKKKPQPPSETDDDVQPEADPLSDDALEADLERLDQIDDRAVEAVIDYGDVDFEFDTLPSDPTEAIKERIRTITDNGGFTAAQERRLDRLADKYKQLPNPYGAGTLEEFRTVTLEDLQLDPEAIKIPEMAGVTDESMLSSTLKAFDKQYVSQVMNKDITNMTLAVQDAGVIVNDYQVETVEDAANHYQVITMRVTPIDGEPSTLRYRLPIVNDEGVFVANNVKYRLRKQRADQPIRKINPASVALTSYYAKVFVDRSEKSVVNYPKWLTNQLVSLGLDAEDTTVTDIKHTDTFINTVELPRIYTILAKRFREFKVKGGYRFYLDYQRRVAEFGEEVIKAHETDGFVVCGTQGKNPLVVDSNSVFYVIKDGRREDIGSLEDIVGLDTSKAPVEVAEFRLFSRNVPVVIALGHRWGLSKLLQILKVTHRRVSAGARLELEPDEYVIRFADESLILRRENSKANLILAGLNRYHRSIKQYNIDAFDDSEVYANIMEENGMRIGFIRELELAMDMFVDPITKSLLESMNEPVSLDRLLIRACELLTNDAHPDETDMAAMRIRGYERMAGAVYGEMISSLRKYRSRGVGTAAKLEMNPEAVWLTINQDPSISQVEESNPIQNLKEQELVTYMGTGGRTSKSMVKRTRKYHKSDMGIISESTPDSQTVGVNAYLTANPQLKDLRGLGTAYESGKTPMSAMLSTSALLSPNADMDDPKRVNFISIQNAHIVASEGYRPIPVRTGYERVIAHRVSDLYAYAATGPGEIVKLDKQHVHIQYKDGTEAKVELGTRYGAVLEMTVPHQVVCDLAVGSKVKEGDIVAYNTGYFERDPLERRQVLLKTSMLVKTAIMERSHTYEDASIISQSISDKLSTQVTKVRTVVVGFEQTIKDLVSLGSTVDIETILCTIEDSATSDDDLFDENSRDLLKVLSSHVPKAKSTGTVDKIEVFYHGDLDDATESVRALALQSDKERVRRLKTLGKTPTTGSVDGFVRIDKDPLELDTIAIRFYITERLGAGMGDKGVFGNQLKTVFSYIMSGRNETETGVPLDAVFGGMSISNRITLSPEVMGTTNTLLMLMSKRVAQKYKSIKSK